MRFTLARALKVNNLLFDVVDIAREATRIVFSVKRQEIRKIQIIIRGSTSRVLLATNLSYYLSNILSQPI